MTFEDMNEEPLGTPWQKMIAKFIGELRERIEKLENFLFPKNQSAKEECDHPFTHRVDKEFCELCGKIVEEYIFESAEQHFNRMEEDKPTIKVPENLSELTPKEIIEAARKEIEEKPKDSDPFPSPKSVKEIPLKCPHCGEMTEFYNNEPCNMCGRDISIHTIIKQTDSEECSITPLISQKMWDEKKDEIERLKSENKMRGISIVNQVEIIDDLNIQKKYLNIEIDAQQTIIEKALEPIKELKSRFIEEISYDLELILRAEEILEGSK